MEDRPITATECLRRMSVWGRRAALQIALSGSDRLLFTYCIDREFSKEAIDALVYGSSVYKVDDDRALRVWRNYNRLLKLKKARHEASAQ